MREDDVDVSCDVYREFFHDTFLSQRSFWRCRLLILIFESVAGFRDRYRQSVFVLQRLQQLLKFITALDIRDFQYRYRNVQRLG